MLIFFQFFYLEFSPEESVILFTILISISHENTIDIPLPSKKRRQAKFCLVDVWRQVFLFTGETSFSIHFFFNIPGISVQIQKPTKFGTCMCMKMKTPKFNIIFAVFSKVNSIR